MSETSKQARNILHTLKTEYNIGSVEEFYEMFEKMHPLDVGCFVSDIQMKRRCINDRKQN